jgi:hypothetical protein|tara:strand:+ start:249 stop:425 length:177 start_codon:yes stop_codon:yes gene_type:complete
MVVLEVVAQVQQVYLALVYTLVMVVQVYSPQLMGLALITVLVAQEVQAIHQGLMVTMA